MQLFRFVAALVVGFLLEAIVLHGLFAQMRAGALLSGIAALLVAMLAMALIGGGRRARYLLMISALFSAFVYMAMVLLTPDLQPVAARLLSSAAAIAFALFGYARFVARR